MVRHQQGRPRRNPGHRPLTGQERNDYRVGVAPTRQTGEASAGKARRSTPRGVRPNLPLRQCKSAYMTYLSTRDRASMGKLARSLVSSRGQSIDNNNHQVLESASGAMFPQKNNVHDSGQVCMFQGIYQILHEREPRSLAVSLAPSAEDAAIQGRTTLDSP
jgi:hypothetical protein